ncbi:hypothetical protein KJ973_02750 [Patescibacteria group bacterium]|nr:hypothetical protein [Patescibacteria group bacterium]
MTTLTLSKKIEKELKNTSQELGMSKEDFIVNAILFYMKTIEKELTLKKELEIWDKASNEDLLNLEKKI